MLGARDSKVLVCEIVRFSAKDLTNCMCFCFTGKYMQMMNVLKPIAFDVVICMSQLFDYYLFAVGTLAITKQKHYTLCVAPLPCLLHIIQSLSFFLALIPCFLSSPFFPFFPFHSHHLSFLLLFIHSFIFFLFFSFRLLNLTLFHFIQQVTSFFSPEVLVSMNSACRLY